MWTNVFSAVERLCSLPACESGVTFAVNVHDAKLVAISAMYGGDAALLASINTTLRETLETIPKTAAASAELLRGLHSVFKKGGVDKHLEARPDCYGCGNPTIIASWTIPGTDAASTENLRAHMLMVMCSTKCVP